MMGTDRNLIVTIVKKGWGNGYDRQGCWSEGTADHPRHHH